MPLITVLDVVVRTPLKPVVVVWFSAFIQIAKDRPGEKISTTTIGSIVTYPAVRIHAS